ncbi:MAG: GNAT superfamily N-acetyltransferase [Planctomycetota bacterium]|jgi:GNAT superfamily N-acetyltransferase
MADPTSTSNDDLELEICGAESRDDQVTLFNRCFDKHVKALDLRWRYDQSPHGQSACVLLRAPDKQPVCGFSYSPRTFIPHGNEEQGAPCGQQGDVMTDPDWRKRGIASRVARKCEDETRSKGWPMNWGYPNRRSASVFLKLGWRNVGKIRPLTFFFKSDDAARRERYKEGRFAAIALPWKARRSAILRQTFRAASVGGWEAKPLSTFPSEVGELSKLVEPGFDLMVRRDAEFLNWRFIDAPSGRQKAFGIYKDDALAGYVVIQPPVEPGGIGWIVDLLAPEEWAIAAALTTGLDQLEQAGALAARATAVDKSWWQRILNKAGFLAPKAANHLFVYTYPLLDSHPVLDAATDASRWYLCDGDRDDDPIG